MASIIDSTTTAASTSAPAKTVWQSRAVLRVVQPGSWVECESCHEQVKFKVRAQNMQVEAGQPYDEPCD